MDKNKLVKANEKIAETVVEGYKKIEDGVVGGYKKIEEGVVGGFILIEDRMLKKGILRNLIRSLVKIFAPML